MPIHSLLDHAGSPLIVVVFFKVYVVVCRLLPNTNYYRWMSENSEWVKQGDENVDLVTFSMFTLRETNEAGAASDDQIHRPMKALYHAKLPAALRAFGRHLPAESERLPRW
jgi:hypothetical protein